MQVSREIMDKIKEDAVAALPPGKSVFTDIAKHLGISRQAVHMWWEKENIPVDQLIELEAYLVIVGSKVRREDIIPELYQGMV